MAIATPTQISKTCTRHQPPFQRATAGLASSRSIHHHDPLILPKSGRFCKRFMADASAGLYLRSQARWVWRYLRTGRAFRGRRTARSTILRALFRCALRLVAGYGHLNRRISNKEPQNVEGRAGSIRVYLLIVGNRSSMSFRPEGRRRRAGVEESTGEWDPLVPRAEISPFRPLASSRNDKAGGVPPGIYLQT